MSDSQETVDALAKSVKGLEAGRRVGWARSYGAEEREQEALRDLNVARGDLAMVAKFAGFLFGLIQGAAPGAENLAVRSSTAMMSVLPKGAMEAGMLKGKEWRDAQRDPDADEIVAAARRRAKNITSKAHSSEFKGARIQERKKLMQQYGIPNEAALHNWLAQYPGDTPTSTSSG